jgi:hypothetical protein
MLNTVKAQFCNNAMYRKLPQTTDQSFTSFSKQTTVFRKIKLSVKAHYESF